MWVWTHSCTRVRIWFILSSSINSPWSVKRAMWCLYPDISLFLYAWARVYVYQMVMIGYIFIYIHICIYLTEHRERAWVPTETPDSSMILLEIENHKTPWEDKLSQKGWSNISCFSVIFPLYRAVSYLWNWQISWESLKTYLTEWDKFYILYILIKLIPLYSHFHHIFYKKWFPFFDGNDFISNIFFINIFIYFSQDLKNNKTKLYQKVSAKIIPLLGSL